MAEFWEGLGVLDAPTQTTESNTNEWWSGLGTLDSAPASPPPAAPSSGPSPLDLMRQNDAAAKEQGIDPYTFNQQRGAEFDTRSDASQFADAALQTMTNNLPVRTVAQSGANIAGNLSNILLTLGNEAVLDYGAATGQDLSDNPVSRARSAISGAMQEYAQQQADLDKQGLLGETLTGGMREALGMVGEMMVLPQATAAKGAGVLKTLATKAAPLASYMIASSTARSLEDSDARGETGFTKYARAAANGTIDGAFATAMVAFGSGLGKLASGESQGFVQRAVQYLTNRYSLSTPVAKLVAATGEGGSQVAFGAATNAVHYINDVAFGRQEWDATKLAESMGHGALPAAIAGVVGGALHPIYREVADTLEKRAREFPTVAKAFEDAQSTSSEIAQKLLAWHASPRVDIQEFSTDFVGSGEGSQAYGHGLYFGGNEKTGLFYKEQFDNERGGGHLYQAELLPKPNEYLDWDKPLREQHENIRNAMKSLGLPEANEYGSENRGSDLHELLRTRLRDAIIEQGSGGRSLDEMAAEFGKVDQAVSEKLLAAGVRGVRYLDAGSRSASSTDPTHNYVVFDPRDARIVRPTVSRREFGKITGNKNTSKVYREAFIDELSRMNDEAAQDSQVASEAGAEPDLAGERYARKPLTPEELKAHTKEVARLRRREVLPQDTLNDLDRLDPRIASDLMTQAGEMAQAKNEELATLRSEYKTVVSNNVAQSARMRERHGGDASRARHFDEAVQLLRDGEYPSLAHEASVRGRGDLEAGLFDIVQKGAKQFVDVSVDDTLPDVLEQYRKSQKPLPQQPVDSPPPSETPAASKEPETAQADYIGLPPAINNALQKVADATAAIPEFHDYRKSVLNWSARNQKSTGEIMSAVKDIKKAIPDSVRREAITNWIQAAGDPAELQTRAASSASPRKEGYEAALTLTPEELAVAQKVRDTYDTLLKRAKSHGIEINELPNYVNQIWKRQPFKEFFASNNRKLSTNVRFSKERFYESFFHGEQAGLKPQTKDIAKLLPIYMNEINNAISAKELVAELNKGTASDGRPLLAPTGAVQVVDDPTQHTQSYFVLPKMPEAETTDYKSLDQQALHSWTWRASDTENNPIFVKGDLRVHPEFYHHLKNVLGDSAIREWYRSPSENVLGDVPKAVVKFFVDDVQSVGKATMLGFLSPFHQVQEGTHAVGHRVNPFANLPKIDLNEPSQMDAAQHGLMLLPDRLSSKQFREGLDGSTKNIAANLIGLGGKPGKRIKQWVDSYQEYLFHNYIPALKLKTYDHMVERNRSRFKDDLASGKITEEQLKYLSAQQANAAYGHLNYADIGRHPTMQHIAQAFLLAPDFLEARAKFAGQSLVGVFSKTHREQFAAMALLAGVMFAGARVMNKVIDDDWHWDHPFEVIAGNRRYRMRSVPEDIYEAFANTRQFITGRLSPLVGRGLLEGLSGVNYRGERTPLSETLTNIIGGMVPMTLQPLTRGLSETGRDNPVSPLEQFVSSIGLHVSRYSPTSKVFDLARDWIEKHGKDFGLENSDTVYPVSKYQQLRYALEDDDEEKAASEITKLLEAEKIDPTKLGQRVKESFTKPFTGSKKTDRAFRASLDEDGRKLYDAAVERQKLMLVRYRKALIKWRANRRSASPGPAPSPALAPQGSPSARP